MNILATVRALLLDDATYKAGLLGGIFNGVADQDSEWPNMVMTIISGREDWTQQGRDKIVESRIQMVHRGQDISQITDTLQPNCINLMQAYNDRPAKFEMYGARILNIFHINNYGDYQDGQQIHRTIDDFRVRYKIL